VVLRALFTRYILATILVVLGMALLVWLGFWQLDRQEQKRTFNTMMAERWRMEPFDLTAFALPADLSPRWSIAGWLPPENGTTTIRFSSATRPSTAPPVTSW
jgi:hypothetical protein